MTPALTDFTAPTEASSSRIAISPTHTALMATIPKPTKATERSTVSRRWRSSTASWASDHEAVSPCRRWCDAHFRQIHTSTGFAVGNSRNIRDERPDRKGNLVLNSRIFFLCLQMFRESYSDGRRVIFVLKMDIDWRCSLDTARFKFEILWKSVE